MPQFVVYDQRVGEEYAMQMPLRRVAEIRREPGLVACPALPELAALRHHLQVSLVGAMQAMEGAGRIVGALTEEVPWECTTDMARQVWDKGRHIEIFLQLLAHVEGYLEAYPEVASRWRGAGPETPEAHGAARELAGTACDALALLIALAKKMGEPVLERALDFVLADEITRTRLGSKWRHALLAHVPEHLRKAFELQQHVS